MFISKNSADFATTAKPKPPRKRGGKHSNQFIKAKEEGRTIQSKKAAFTERRWQLREQLWKRVALAARYHILFGPKGAAMRMAEAIGTQPSQIHRFTCPECEHDQESSFSVGMAIMLYLTSYQQRQQITIDVPMEVIALRRMHYSKTTGELEFE